MHINASANEKILLWKRTTSTAQTNGINLFMLYPKQSFSYYWREGHCSSNLGLAKASQHSLFLLHRIIIDALVEEVKPNAESAFIYSLSSYILKVPAPNPLAWRLEWREEEVNEVLAGKSSKSTVHTFTLLGQIKINIATMRQIKQSQILHLSSKDSS